MAKAPLDQEKTKKRNTFTQQPDDIYDLDYLSGPEISVWLFLNTHSDNYNPTLNEIAKKSRHSKPTARSAIKSLESMNMLTVKRGKKGSREINKYSTIEDMKLWKSNDQVKERPSYELNRDPRTSKGETLVRVKERPSKNNKENNKENNIVRDPPVDNFIKKIPDEIQNEIKELSNQIHPHTDKDRAGKQLSYYLKIERANPGRVVDAIVKVLRAQNITYNLPKGIRHADGKLIFDNAYKAHFEATIDMHINSS
jgi:DNA-binding MarR family transcriptional regulator